MQFAGKPGRLDPRTEASGTTTRKGDDVAPTHDTAGNCVGTFWPWRRSLKQIDLNSKSTQLRGTPRAHGGFLCQLNTHNATIASGG